MTATTKEILGQFYRLYEGVTTAIPRPRDYREADRDRLFHLVLKELPSLLSDSERLAAIEAVTGGRADKLADYLSCVANGDPVSITLTQEAATAILSLSAKVAELEAENDGFISLRGELETLSSWQIRAQGAEAKVAEQAEEIERLKRGLAETTAHYEKVLERDGRVASLRSALRGMACGGSAFEAIKRERGALSRLLTETAVPALESMAALPNHLGWTNIGTTPGWTEFANAHVNGAKSALSTIRAHMEAANA